MSSCVKVLKNITKKCLNNVTCFFIVVIVFCFNSNSGDGYCGIESPQKRSVVESVKNEGDTSELSFSD